MFRLSSERRLDLLTQGTSEILDTNYMLKLTPWLRHLELPPIF
jgi:hypothetical protein